MPTETVAEAVRRDLAELAQRDHKLAESPLAMTCLALARELDDPGNSATSKSMCAQALAKVWTQLLDLAPPEEIKDRIDELQAAREERLARQAGAEDRPSPEADHACGAGGD